MEQPDIKKQKQGFLGCLGFIALLIATGLVVKDALKTYVVFSTIVFFLSFFLLLRESDA